MSSNRRLGKIGIVGSGIAGLAATWYLGDQFDVTLYEKHASIGMDAFSTDFRIGDQSFRIDLPYRVVKGDFYLTLMQLYKEAKIPLRRIDYAFTMSKEDGETYFGYKNLSIFGKYVSTLKMVSLANSYNRKMTFEMLRFYRHGLRQNPGRLTMDEFLDQHKFSNEFRDKFLYPIYATINTCSYKSAGSYPAASYIEYHTSGTGVAGVYHTSHGTIDVAQKLSAKAQKIRYSEPAVKVVPTAKGAKVITDKSEIEYDHVVIASQANQAAKFLDAENLAEKKALEKIRYEPSVIYTHTDKRYMPRDRKHWEPASFIVSEKFDKPAGSLWLNALEPKLADAPDLFQSWNPLFETEESNIVNTARFERPVMNFDAVSAIEDLKTLHARANRKIWLCGSYMRVGVPLLEAGVVSAKDIARRIQSISF